jgi:hypothetical protein
MSETPFTQVQYALDVLVSQRRMGQIGLPEIRREFI